MRKDNFFSFCGVFLCLCVIMPLLFLRCTGAKTVENNMVRNDSLLVRRDSVRNDKVSNRESWLHDSVYVHDSTYVLVRGDTVYIDRWHNKTISKVLKVKNTDTIVKQVDHFVTQTVTKYRDRNIKVEVEKKLTAWQKLKQSLGGVALFVVIFFLVRIVYINVKCRGTN